MSAASARRLKRLEEITPDTSWTAHIIWAHTPETFEEQRAEMLASGRARAADLILWDILKDGEPLRPPKTETYDKPWAALLDEMAEEDRQKEMPQ